MFANHSSTFEAATAVLPAEQGPPGLFPGTRVETEHGWRDVATLCRGDRVFTLDGGLKPLRDLRRAAGGADAVRIAAGVLECDRDTFLPPAQLVLLDTGWAIDWLGTPVALARAADLVGHAGIRLRVAPGRDLVSPVFAEEEIVFAATGLRVFGPGATTLPGPEHFALLERSEIGAVLQGARAVA